MFEAGARNNKTVFYVPENGGFVMFHDTSCHSLQCSCLSVFKVSIIAFFDLNFAANSLHSQGDDSDVELTGVEYYPPPPASLDELEEEQQDEGSTAPVGEQEKEEKVRTCVVNFMCLRWTLHVCKHHLRNNKIQQLSVGRTEDIFSTCNSLPW